MWKWTLIYITLLMTFTLAIEEDIYQNDEGIVKQFRPDTTIRQGETDSVIYGVDEGIPEQRNYQPGFNTNYNLDNTQNDLYTIDFKYHDYEKMTRFLRETSSRFPSLTALYSIGKSVQGNFHLTTHSNNPLISIRN